MQSIILVLANPFVVAFLFPFFLVFILTALAFNINIPAFELLGKTAQLPIGDPLLFNLSEVIYNHLPTENFKHRWALWFTHKTPLDIRIFTIWASINAGIIAGSLSVAWRYISYFYAVQFKRQTMESDRQFMKKK